LANLADGANRAPPKPIIGMPLLRRLALWGLAGAGALALAAYASSTMPGHRRIKQVIAHIHDIGRATETNPDQLFDHMEARRLAEAVRILEADRASLHTWIASLENNLATMTASLTQIAASAHMAQHSNVADIKEPAVAGATATLQTAVPAASSPVADASYTPTRPSTTVLAAAPGDKPVAMTKADAETTSSANMPSLSPKQALHEEQLQPPETNAVDAAEYGLDLGGASTIEGVRALWVTTQRRHVKQFDGLHPILRLRERGRKAGVELRLVVGPLNSAAMAARLCVAITEAGTNCQPTLFDGQRLALR
jgi:hypothetical protein